MTMEKMIFNLQIVKEIMTDATYNGIEDEHHFDGAERYINEVIDELVKRKNKINVKVEVSQHEKIESGLFIVNIWINGGNAFKFKSERKLSDSELRDLELHLRTRIKEIMKDVEVEFFNG